MICNPADFSNKCLCNHSAHFYIIVMISKFCISAESVVDAFKPGLVSVVGVANICLHGIDSGVVFVTNLGQIEFREGYGKFKFKCVWDFTRLVFVWC